METLQEQQTQNPQPEKPAVQAVPENLTEQVAKFKPNVPEQPVKQDGPFNYNDLENISDPQAKEVAMKAYKSFQSDYTRKMQALAEERKRLAQPENIPQRPEWTPDKIRSITQDPEFIKAAQEYMGSSSSDNELPPEVQRKIQEMEEKTQLAMQQVTELAKRQQDEALKQKYPDYNPAAIDTLTADMLSGKVQATREDLWKIHNFDNFIKNAYLMGKQDRNLDFEDKRHSTSFEGQQMAESPDKPQPEEGESSRSYLQRLLFHNMTKKDSAVRK